MSSLTRHVTIMKSDTPSSFVRISKRISNTLGRAASIAFLSSGLLILAFALVSLLAPYLWTTDPGRQNLRARYTAPTEQYLMGTDALGRDVFIRVIYGTRVSLGVALATGLASALAGGLLGFFAGFHGGRLDTVLSRCVDMIMAFPTVLLAIIIIVVMGSGVINLIVAITLSSLPSFYRVARSAALPIRQSDFIMAANSIGSPGWWQILHHVIPNGLPLIVVLTTARMGTVILTEASLSFLGLGVPPDMPSWGSMIAAGRTVLRDAPWTSLAPGLAITLVVLSFNQFGDGLRDLFDPRMRGAGLDR